MTTVRAKKAQPHGSARAMARPQVVRIFMPVRALVPLGLGIIVAGAMSALAEAGYLEGISQMEAAARFTVVWVVPICVGGLVASLRTLMVEITPGGVLVRRACGLSRFYAPSQIEMWGFRQGPGAWGKLPPSDARRGVQFILRTTRGWTFRKAITGGVAQQISTLMLRQRPGA